MDNRTGQLSPGFIPVSEAKALIERDSKDNPTVDIATLVRTIAYIEDKHNYRIPLLKKLGNGKIVGSGSTYTYIVDSYEMEILKRAIKDKYKEYLGKELDETKTLRRMTTVSEEEGASTRPTKNSRSETPAGYDLPDGLSGK